MTKPLDERIEEIRKQVQASVAQVSSYKQILEAISDGSTHIIAAPNTYTIPKTLFIPEDVTLEVLEGEFLFKKKAGIMLEGSIQDKDKRVTFDGIKGEWKNITSIGGNIYFKHAHLKNGTAHETYYRNYSQWNGGIIYSKDGQLELGENTLIEGGRAHAGGGIYIDGGSFTLNGVVTKNYGSSGGGVCITGEHYSNEKPSVVGGSINNNSGSSGGGILTTRPLLINGIVEENVAHEGGGIFIRNTSLVIEGQIQQNEANRGGGIYSNQGNIWIKGSTKGQIRGEVIQNVASRGGGIYFHTKEDGNLKGTGYISQNEASQGGGIYGNTTGSRFKGFITDNQSKLPGGGVFSTSSNPVQYYKQRTNDNSPDNIRQKGTTLK